MLQDVEVLSVKIFLSETRLKAVLQYLGADTSLPRLKMTLESVDETKTPQDPDLHVLLSGQYVRIWEAQNIEEFKQAFLDCVECESSSSPLNSYEF